MDRNRISRRRFLETTAAVATAVAAPYVVSPSRAANKELVFVGFGGAYQEGQTKAYFEPFERETGVKIIQTSGVELAKLKAQVQSKNVEWDLVTLPDRQRYTAVQDGLLAPLNYSIIDKSDILPEVISEHAL